MFLLDELEQNGIACYIPELLAYKLLALELDYALRPVLHERKIQPYGFIVCNEQDSPIHKQLSELILFDLSEARNLADGCHSFLVFVEGKFKGVLILEEGVDNDLQLNYLSEKLKSIIVTTNIQGVTKIICSRGIFIHEYRRWRKKTSVQDMRLKIRFQIPKINSKILQKVLDFCFHELSPRNIGTILVWCLSEDSLDKLENFLATTSLGNFKKELNININLTSNWPVIRHVSRYTDGATVIDRQGIIVGVGIHLKYSENSQKVIYSYKGTRHTSAQRFSYDFPETVLFVVSEDGAISVFFKGMNIGNLEEGSCSY